MQKKISRNNFLAGSLQTVNKQIPAFFNLDIHGKPVLLKLLESGHLSLIRNSLNTKQYELNQPRPPGILKRINHRMSTLRKILISIHSHP